MRLAMLGAKGNNQPGSGWCLTSPPRSGERLRTMTPTNFVFVYGTLMQDQPNAHLLADAWFGGFARTKPDYTMLHLGGFPAIIPAPEGHGVGVYGEVYEVDRDTLARLDQLEGVPHFYRRETITLECDVEAFVYVLNTDDRYIEGRPVIESGDWLDAA